MGIFDALLGSEKVVSKIADGVYDGIDAAVYTDEEKAKNELEKKSLKVRLLEAYQPFKLAQRFLALIFGIPFVLLWIIIAMCWLVSIFAIGPGLEYKFIYEQLKLVGEMNNETLGTPCAVILGFYFFGGASEGLVRAAREKTRS
ncbi:hypothetical protein [Vibrio harveyi]|uniref:hypothetical protein n=1 Tax=Vibrio harveyi TaxID=669 RepID=UPI000D789198|nr:hypothetical protein [Vibrio harveyi]HDM8061666.1 hypothetical protein [Vibrio harveyi]